jgi:DNA uptake protein ComE-like DNA-binding protein
MNHTGLHPFFESPARRASLFHTWLVRSNVTRASSPCPERSNLEDPAFFCISNGSHGPEARVTTKQTPAATCVEKRGLQARAITEKVHRRANRRGAIFIIALAITVILSALLLVFVRQMRTEATSSAYRLSAAQADGVEQGAEQWVLAQIEANTPALSAGGTSGTSGGTSSTGSTSTTAVDVTTIPAEALQVGNGYFWILHPDPTQDQTYAFGITDESGKLNLNGATVDQLLNLPNMTQDIANAITTWPSSVTATEVGTGATVSASTSVPYETVEEALMAETQSPPQMPLAMYGYDLNHDGVLDNNERTLSNGAANTNGTTSDSRGFFNYVTVYSTDAQPTSTTTGGGGAAVGPGGIPVKTDGLINVNTAPEQVLMCLPGLTQADADSLVSARTGGAATIGSTDWVTTTLGQSKAQAIAGYITAVSYQYSADIVAVSGDGRAYKRVRIVVDARQQPAKIVYRKELTGLGWPLDPAIRESLRAGQGVPVADSGTSNQQTGGSVVH